MSTDRVQDLAEVIFVNDGSRVMIRRELFLIAASVRFPFVKVIELSRNLDNTSPSPAGIVLPQANTFV